LLKSQDILAKHCNKVVYGPQGNEADEIPFELPFNRVWTRLDTICSYIQRNKGLKYIDASDIPVIAVLILQGLYFDVWGLFPWL
jgi:hypothetical protein